MFLRLEAAFDGHGLMINVALEIMLDVVYSGADCYRDADDRANMIGAKYIVCVSPK